MLEIDGAQGEGGGQILRTSLTLSMITGEPFRIINIRANRKKPGLMRQHLVAVNAAAQICDATVNDAQVGSLVLEFAPNKIKSGDYQFAIGTAGSCTLVLQTLIPALLFAEKPSSVKLSGGTHNSMAPPAQFLLRAYGRVLADMGARMDIQLNRYGFYPAGGGEIVATINPCPKLIPVELVSTGARINAFAESFIAGIPLHVAQRELEVVGKAMNWNEEQLLVRGLSGDQGPGNALLLTLENENINNVFCEFGEKNVSAELVAKNMVKKVRHYLASGATVEEHLADQVMLPMALAGGGCFTTNRITQHAKTNASIIEKFLPIEFSFSEIDELKTMVKVEA